MKPEDIEKFRRAANEGTIPDEENPLFVFSTASSSMLAMLAYGGYDPVMLAKIQLADRGLDKQGKWIGAREAMELNFPTKGKPTRPVQKRRGKGL